MSTELGKAYVQIIPSSKGVSGMISESLGGEAAKAGASSGSKLAGALKGVIATAAIGKAIGAALTEGAALQQSIGGIETLFKGSADTVKKYAEEAYKTTGLSANAYMENVTGFSASLLQSLGGDTEKAADIANMAMVDMADNSNKMGTSMESIQVAYQGFAKQNYTMLDNLKLGYGGTKKEMERLLADATKLTGVKYDINNLSDVYEAIHAVQEEIGITGTTAKEASETFTGSFAAMKAAFQNSLGALALGEGITPALTGLAQTVSTFLFKNLIPMVINILKSLPGAIMAFIKEAVPQFLEVGGQLITEICEGIKTGIPNLVTSVKDIVSNVAAWLSEQFPQILENGVEMIVNLGKGIMSQAPQLLDNIGQIAETILSALMDLIPKLIKSGFDLIAGLAKGLVDNLPAIGASITRIIQRLLDLFIEKYPEYIKSGWNLIKNFAKGLLDNLPAVITSIGKIIGDLLKAIADKIPDLLKMGLALIVELGKGLIQAIPGLVSKIPTIITACLDAMRNMISGFLDIGKNIVEGLWEGIKSAAGWLKDKLTGWMDGLLGGIKGFFGIESPSTEMAWIGNMMTEGLAAGISDNTKPVKKAMEGLESLTTGALRSNLAVQATAQGEYFGNGSAVANTFQNRLDQMIDLLEAILKKEGAVLLDGEALVGRTIDRFDKLLAEKQMANDFAFGGSI